MSPNSFYFTNIYLPLTPFLDRHVPKYMLPRGMHVANLNKKRKRRRNKFRSGSQRRTDNDPLQSYNGSNTDLDGVAGTEGEEAAIDEDFDEFFEQGEAGNEGNKLGENHQERKIFSNSMAGTGRSTSGRNVWKEKHRKGKFSNKRRKSEPKRRRIGI